MLVTVIATLCLTTDLATGQPTACVDKIVTDQATFQECAGAFAAQVIPHWMEENGYTARGYHLAKWRCMIGAKPANVI